MLNIVKKYYLAAIGVIILCIVIIINLNESENEMVFEPIISNELLKK